MAEAAENKLGQLKKHFSWSKGAETTKRFDRNIARLLAEKYFIVNGNPYRLLFVKTRSSAVFHSVIKKDKNQRKIINNMVENREGTLEWAREKEERNI